MEWLNQYAGDIQLTSWIFQRVLAAIYLIAFASAFDQFPALLGEKGLSPVPEFTRYAGFKFMPSIFHWHYSDRFARGVSAAGMLMSAILLFAMNDHIQWWCTPLLWLGCYVLYLSIVNVGQTFYSFGWESMLLEAGFFAIFMGPSYMAAAVIPFLILRWMLFRVELGAGLIKMRHDSCWRDLTCLFYHHETQPLPNPLSWYFHRMPKLMHKGGVLFSHVVQLLMPFGLLAPQPFAAIAGAFIIAHQGVLIVSGNYSWLNWLTVALGLTALSDTVFGAVGLRLNLHPVDYPGWYENSMLVLLGGAVLLSVQPTLNFFSKNQLMNFNYNPFHIIGSYGAFGSVTRERYEIVIEGTQDDAITAATSWREYEFKAKPGALNRMPPQIAPYHLRLDWLMWFLPFSVRLAGSRLLVNGYEMWFIRFMSKLLEADPTMLRQIRRSPFGTQRPTFVRARYYLYEYTSAEERRATGNWWKRTLIGDYLPPVRLSDLEPALSEPLVL